MAFLDETGLARLWSHILSKLGTKVDKEEGKGLSSSDFTAAEKEKLAGIETGANKITVDRYVGYSSNPVRNSAVYEEFEFVKKPLQKDEESEMYLEIFKDSYIPGYEGIIKRTENISNEINWDGTIDPDSDHVVEIPYTVDGEERTLHYYRIYDDIIDFGGESDYELQYKDYSMLDVDDQPTIRTFNKSYLFDGDGTDVICYITEDEDESVEVTDNETGDTYTSVVYKPWGTIIQIEYDDYSGGSFSDPRIPFLAQMGEVYFPKKGIYVYFEPDEYSSNALSHHTKLSDEYYINVPVVTEENAYQVKHDYIPGYEFVIQEKDKITWDGKISGNPSVTFYNDDYGETCVYTLVNNLPCDSDNMSDIELITSHIEDPDYSPTTESFSDYFSHQYVNSNNTIEILSFSPYYYPWTKVINVREDNAYIDYSGNGIEYGTVFPKKGIYFYSNEDFTYYQSSLALAGSSNTSPLFATEKYVLKEEYLPEIDSIASMKEFLELKDEGTLHIGPEDCSAWIGHLTINSCTMDNTKINTEIINGLDEPGFAIQMGIQGPEEENFTYYVPFQVYTNRIAVHSGMSVGIEENKENTYLATTKAVADYVAAEIAKITDYEGVEF